MAGTMTKPPPTPSKPPASPVTRPMARRRATRRFTTPPSRLSLGASQGLNWRKIRSKEEQMATATATSLSKLESILGNDAHDLLEHECKTILKSQLHLPGPDFITR